MEDLKKFWLAYPKNHGYEYFFCPGRVNLIGEHIDYNGGYVFPCAIELGIYGAARIIEQEKLVLKSRNMGLEVQVDFDDLECKKEHGWANYPKGIVKEFIDIGHKPVGLEINYYGNLPEGVGLSSSAAIEILTCIIVDSLWNLGVDKLEWIKLSQKVENEYIGVSSGIMDQFAVTMGKRDKAILLDCNTLEYKYSDLKMENHSLVIINSNKKRELSSSKYNERKEECDEGLKILQNYKDIDNLCQLNSKELKDIIQKIGNEKIRRRVRHVVTENERVIKSVKALENKNLVYFGQLLNESHDSLRDDYEVTGLELDILVDEARKCKGVLGSRMTGAGFGGCTITLIENRYIEEFERKVKEAYKKKTGFDAELYYSLAADGVNRI